MTLTLFCMISLILSVLVLVTAIVLSIVVHKAELAKENFDRRRGFALAPFHVFLIGFFIAAAALFYPVYYTDFLVGDTGFVKVLKSVLLSIHNVLRLFVLDGEFDNIRDLLSDSARVGASLGAIYTIYAAIVYVVAPALTAGVVLSFVKDASALLRYTLYPRSDIYLLSELNEKSILLAQDILTNRTDKGRRLVVFADVFEKGEEADFELVTRAKQLGAICMRKDIVEIGLKRSKNIFRKIYLIGEDEDENIQQALTLIERCKNTPRYNHEKTQIYVFATTAESEALLNSVENDQVKVRRINENRNLIIHTLSNGTIFEGAREMNGKKEISIAIVGLGAYGIELLKAICWCGQMPDYEVTIHAFDKEANGEAKIKNIAPELIKYNNKRIKGEPYYNIIFHNKFNAKSYKFQEELSKIDFLSCAFVTLGDDELNIETAMKMRMQFGRDKIKSGKPVPPIYAVVYSRAKTQAVSQGGLQSIDADADDKIVDKTYGITFIGSIQSRYCVENIEQSKLEDDGLDCHKQWCKSAAEEEKAEKRFNKYEYHRRSSIAQAIYLRNREKLLPNLEEETGKEYEHKRWNAFMRSEGYIGLKADSKDHVAKIHPSLIPYDELTPEEKAKDAVTLEKK